MKNKYLLNQHMIKTNTIFDKREYFSHRRDNFLSSSGLLISLLREKVS